MTKKEPNVEGRFAIEADWRDPNAGFYLFTKEKPAGFAIRGINEGRSDIAEFYILPCYRKKGLGKVFAFAIFDLFLGIFGSLALAVASIGIVNTLVMAILERRREIGIMKAIGASDSDVKGLFFAEAGVMGVFGGFVGVALGWTIGRVINLGTNVYLKRQHFPPAQIWSVPLWLVFGAIAFSIVVSLLSGLYPAVRAARLDPVQALRYE